jgi:hypothetical protein
VSERVRYDLEAIRRRVSLVQLVGRRVKLRRAGREFAGLCPFHQEKSPSFTVNDEKGFYHCFGCGAHGDLFRFVADIEGLSFLDAVKSLAEAGEASVTEAPERSSPRALERERRAPADVVDSAELGAWLWRQSVRARGTPVEAWLRSRGLDPTAIAGGLDELRFVADAPSVPWRIGAGPESVRAELRAPAMVAGVRDPATGRVRGVHVTWLSPSGDGKARFPRRGDGSERPSRKILGDYQGMAVFLTGWVDPETAVGRAEQGWRGVVGEGIETVWAWAQRNPGFHRYWAALSLDNLQGFALEGPGGSLPIWGPQADPERPPFTCRHRGPVTVLVDADMKPIEKLVQDKRGAKPAKRWLNALERAELCAALATQAWRRAGADPVTAERPPLGQDFNDVVRGVA